MNARPETPDTIEIEINGRKYPARKGQMLIEVADAHGIPVPRFCYHRKLPVAANCRMCLVEVEKAPKPLPACATPVMDGMVVRTDSPYAREAQRSVMEFLLINHPLDCPICDQGGECELQDLALEYGGDRSRYLEGKRSVADKDIGPLVATEMTRCILCTRCVRFLEHIAGIKELGGIGRGEHTEISTYVERALTSELSGNIIDVCPVGALTSKPFRFQARAWELRASEAIAPHDCVGSNLEIHQRRDEVLRVVPRENEAINEVWLSDRDRFSYEGLHAADRLCTPQVKQDGAWREVSWEALLDTLVPRLKAVVGDDGDALGVLVSPSATLEEMYLLNRLAEGLGCRHIDHRLRTLDFSDQDTLPSFPTLGQTIEDFGRSDAFFLIGSWLRKEQPILGHRLRMAALAGARVAVLNPIDYEFLFPIAQRHIVRPSAMPRRLAGIVRALAEHKGIAVPDFAADVEVDAHQRETAELLLEARAATVVIGTTAMHHPQAAMLRSQAAWLAEQSDSILALVTDGANAAGAWLAGCLPHRSAAGALREPAGHHAAAMLEAPRRAYFLFGMDPDADVADPAALDRALGEAELVVAFTAFDHPRLRERADFLLPIASFGETSGTFVNAEGRWQSFPGAVPPPGAARPGWKVLRALGSLLALPGFTWMSSEEVRDELRARVGEAKIEVCGIAHLGALPRPLDGLERCADVPAYAVDALVRRAPSLQATPDGGEVCARLHPDEIERLGLAGAARVRVRQGTAEAVLPLTPDAAVPEGVAWIPGAAPNTRALGLCWDVVTLERVD